MLMTTLNLDEKLQSAYKKLHSTETALLKVHDDILRTMDRGCTVVLLLLDLSAAFDTVEHGILLHRLDIRFGIKGKVLAWFKSYLTDRSQFVSINGSNSSHSDLMFEVPQESLLGPILYLLYTSPLGDIIRRHDMNFHFYAVDCQVYFSLDSVSPVTTMRIEACLQDSGTWMSLNKLKLNGDKTELLVIGSGNLSASQLPSFTAIDGSVIQPSNYARNIGCKENLTRRDMDDHKMRECIWRTDSCEYCQGSFIVKNRQQHHNVCQKFPVQCTNNCGLKTIPREQLVAHIHDDCPLTEVPCKYKNLGCQEVFLRNEDKSHLECHMESHLNLALCSLEITQNQVKDQSKQIERLTSTFNDQIASLVAKNVEQSQQITSLTSIVEGLVLQIERLKGQDKYQAVQVNKTTNEAIDGPNKKGATNVKIKESDNIELGFKPKSINDIEVGMEVFFRVGLTNKRCRGTVKYVGYVERQGYCLGVEVDPDHGIMIIRVY
ncbi:TNF receptor-associated factor 4 [Stylophora pistillata]|uniref:TNF receptor-associated factor 4 n=1 Tax=Stylophora pistillata TaxID=50429 RepID=A0A2B4RSU3_STYPI|nr:TNF receptor-associated factor 4 [Stylophora pistillata]